MNKKILARLRKVMKLTESPDPGEAAAALAMAQKIMEEYNVTQSDVDMLDVQENATSLYRNRPTGYQVALIRLVSKIFSVHPYTTWNNNRRSYDVSFVGLGANAEIACYCYAVLYRKCVAARKEYYSTLSKRMKRSNKVRRADIFAQGWARGCEEAAAHLVPPAEETNELITKYLDQKDLVTHKARSAKATKRNLNDFVKGAVAGSQVSISKPVNGNEPIKYI